MLEYPVTPLVSHREKFTHHDTQGHDADHDGGCDRHDIERNICKLGKDEHDQ